MYVEPEDAEALVSAILHLRQHPEVAEELGNRGRAFVQARFDRERLTTKLDAQVARLLEKQAPISIPMAASTVTVEEKRP